MKKILMTVLAMTVLAVTAPAQSVDRAELDAAVQGNSLGVMPVDQPFSLIDLSRLQWSHSYSVSYLSGGGNSATLGMFTTSMFYEFSPKLSLLLNVGIAHNAGAIWGDGNNDATILPGFVLDYHPSEKFRMSIGVQTYGSGWYPGYGRSWYNRGWYGSY